LRLPYTTLFRSDHRGVAVRGHMEGLSEGGESVLVCSRLLTCGRTCASQGYAMHVRNLPCIARRSIPHRSDRAGPGGGRTRRGRRPVGAAPARCPPAYCELVIFSTSRASSSWASVSLPASM